MSIGAFGLAPDEESPRRIGTLSSSLVTIRLFRTRLTLTVPVPQISANAARTARRTVCPAGGSGLQGRPWHHAAGYDAGQPYPAGHPDGADAAILSDRQTVADPKGRAVEPGRGRDPGKPLQCRWNAG